MTRLNDFVRGRYTALLKDAPVRLRAEHWQKRFDGDRAGAVLTALRMAVSGGRQGPEEDIYACYPRKSYFDRQGFEEMLTRRDVISFDVFDTLLFRKVDKPTDVFSLIEKEAGKPGFARDRVASERQAREKKSAEKGTGEVTIDDIYRMPAMEAYGTPETLIERELSAERRVCYANPVMPGILERLRIAGKTVIVTSDMYLPCDFIRELLESAGFHGIEECFVSGDYGAGKGSGLFDAVRRYADGGSTVHIGDNFAGDVFPLRGSDITPVHYLAGGKKRKGERN